MPLLKRKPFPKGAAFFFVPITYGTRVSLRLMGEFKFRHSGPFLKRNPGPSQTDQVFFIYTCYSKPNDDRATCLILRLMGELKFRLDEPLLKRKPYQSQTNQVFLFVLIITTNPEQ